MQLNEVQQLVINKKNSKTKNVICYRIYTRMNNKMKSIPHKKTATRCRKLFLKSVWCNLLSI